MLVCQAKGCGFKSHLFRMVMKLMLSIIFSLIALFFTSYLNLSIFFTEFFSVTLLNSNSITSSLNITAVPLDFLHYLYFEDQMSLIFVFAVLSMLITLLLFVLSYLYSHLAASSGGVFLLQPTERDEEYECGYGAFGHAQTN